MGKIVNKGMACILLLGLCVVLIWIVPGEDETWEEVKALQTEQIFSEQAFLESSDTSQAEDCHVNRKDTTAEKSEGVGEEKMVTAFMDKSEEKKNSESVGEELKAASVSICNMGCETQENTGETSEESVGESEKEVVTDNRDEDEKEVVADNRGEDEKEVVTGNDEEDENGSDADTSQEDSDHRTQEDSQENSGHSVQEAPQENPDHSTREDISETEEESMDPGTICQSQGHVFQVSIWETPTCLKGGYYNNICERCGLVECVTQPALSHEVEDITIQEGNCMEDTIIRHRCKNCGQQIKSDTRFTPQIHQWGSAVVDGQPVTYCEWCGVTQ